MHNSVNLSLRRKSVLYCGLIDILPPFSVYHTLKGTSILNRWTILNQLKCIVNIKNKFTQFFKWFIRIGFFVVSLLIKVNNVSLYTRHVNFHKLQMCAHKRQVGPSGAQTPIGGKLGQHFLMYRLHRSAKCY